MVRNLGIAVVILCFCAVVGFLVIVTPDNALVQLFRTSITDSADARVITGPYPLEKDFRVLQSTGIRKIISLLNPAIYYENVLLQKEIELARKYGIEVVNYPMGSILGQKFGSSYEVSAESAAKDAATSGDKVYLHCYLGVHRVKAVLARLPQQATTVTGAYNQRQGERSTAALTSDAASAAYRAADYDNVIALLSDQEKLGTDQLILLGWAFFKKNDLANSKRNFQEVLHRNDRHGGAAVGLGYVALREGNTSIAERYFLTATALQSGDAQAWSGLGLVHFRLGQHTLAQAELKKSLELDPADVESRQILAKLQAVEPAGSPAPDR